MKKILKTAAALLCVCILSVFAVSCSADKAEDIIGSVRYPESYRIVYEVEDKDGVIRTVGKSVDADGNVYFCSGENETVFIREGKSYVEYVKDESGEFICESGKKVDADYVASATAEFSELAEQSKNKFMPTVKEAGTSEIVGRGCTVYAISVGIKAFGISYFYYVDEATGICLSYDVEMVLAGIDVESDDTVYVCVEFITDEIEPITVQ